MLRKLMIGLCSLLVAGSLSATENPRVLLTTSLGEIELELNEEKAPITVKNFLSYVDSKFYDDTQFHRVIGGFMIQGGGFDANMQQKQTQAPIQNEANNGLLNKRGSISMARLPAVHSATSQFFINLSNNTFLDHGARDFGYAVFGQVTKGMDVVDQIARVPTGTRNGHGDVPLHPVMIISARRL